jgi:ABC-type nickel/cobalt efflux system permease component RcnA
MIALRNSLARWQLVFTMLVVAGLLWRAAAPEAVLAHHADHHADHHAVASDSLTADPSDHHHPASHGHGHQDGCALCHLVAFATLPDAGTFASRVAVDDAFIGNALAFLLSARILTYWPQPQAPPQLN